MECYDILNYFEYDNKIKNNLAELSKECPDKVLQFLLKPESKTTITKLHYCEFSDSIDKKFLNKLLIRSCDQL